MPLLPLIDTTEDMEQELAATERTTGTLQQITSEPFFLPGKPFEFLRDDIDLVSSSLMLIFTK